MKVRIGIVGYGNLGKAVECEILKHSNLKLIAIFSRRNIISRFQTPIEPYQNFKLYKNKIDVMMLCGGSMQDLEPQTEEIASLFDCINSFDNHSKIAKHLQNIDKIATNSRHRAIISCGWDPGLFSNIRAMIYKFLDAEPITFWGKGISMGHSDAVRQVKGVDDGVQFTIPNKEAMTLAGKGRLDQQTPRHFRECFIASSSIDKARIESEIKNIPSYFKGQPTIVNFVSQEKILKLKSKMFHGGEIIGISSNNKSSKFSMKFTVKMSSNPAFTAKLMTAYINAILRLKQTHNHGAFTPLDIPVSYLYKDRTELVKKFC